MNPLKYNLNYNISKLYLIKNITNWSIFLNKFHKVEHTSNSYTPNLLHSDYMNYKKKKIVSPH